MCSVSVNSKKYGAGNTSLEERHSCEPKEYEERARDVRDEPTPCYSSSTPRRDHISMKQASVVEQQYKATGHLLVRRDLHHRRESTTTDCEERAHVVHHH